MKRTLVFLNVLLVLSSCTQQSTEYKSDEKSWNTQKRKMHLNNRNDSTAWDMKMLKDDREDIDFGNFGPFQLGVFPQPKYDLIGKGSFKGVGVVSGEFEVKNRTVLMRGFFVKENALNKERLRGRNDDVFFQVIVLTDTIDNVNYNLAQSLVLSRNHPDYLGQGFIKTKTNNIEFMGFTTAEKEAYAIINTRVFNLRFGRTILIAPQKDKTLRSLQIDSPPLTSEAITTFTEELIKENKVLAFFQDSGNI